MENKLTANAPVVLFRDQKRVRVGVEKRRHLKYFKRISLSVLKSETKLLWYKDEKHIFFSTHRFCVRVTRHEQGESTHGAGERR